MARAGNFSSGLFSSCRQAISAWASPIHSSSTSSPPLTPSTLKVAIFTPRRLSGVASGSAAAASFAFVAPLGFDRPAQLDRHRRAVPVDRLAGLDADPAFRDAIFLDVLPL